MIRYLAERVTFDQLFRMSDPKRVTRSFKVKGPPLEIDSYQDAVYYAYNFKSFPSTTGLRHRGYVKFLRPKLGGQKPLQHLNCIVDCTCPDYRYRWAWANKQRGASRVGPQSLNQALNRAPRRTNPTSRPGLCKHILAAREYVYGLLSSFPNDTPDTADKLNKLTQFAQKRWINMPAQMQAARDRDRLAAAARNARNAGQPAPQDLPLPPVEEPNADGEGREPGDEEAYRDILPPDIEDTPELARLPAPPPPRSYAAGINPPAQRGRGFPAGKSKEDDRRQKNNPKLPPNKSGDLAAKAGFNSPAAYNFARRKGLGDSFGYEISKPKMERVVNTNVNDMNTELITKSDRATIGEAQRLITELEQDELASLRAAGRDDEDDSRDMPPGDGGGDQEFGQGGAPDATPMGAAGDVPPGDDLGGDAGADMGAGAGMGAEALSPSEAPVSDSAVGADSEGQLALSFLREIRDFLGQLASALAPAQEPGEGEEGMEGGAPGGEFGGGAEGEGEEGEFGDEVPVEDPAAEQESEGEVQHGEEGGEGEEGDDGEEDSEKKRKEPSDEE